MGTIYQTPVHLIGGNGGCDFYINVGDSGRTLRKIGVWAGEWYIGGIRAWWTGLDSPTSLGTCDDGSYKEFAFGDDERITKLSLWGNGEGTRSGGIRFFTDKSREFFHYMTSYPLKQEYAIEVASGLCIGLMGKHGANIDCLGFIFLRDISWAVMRDVSYPTLRYDTPGIVPVTLDKMKDSNSSGHLSKSWSFSGSRTVVLSSAWEMTRGVSFHVNASVKGTVPTVLEVGEELGWATSKSETKRTSYEEARTLSWNESGVLGPGEWISLEAITHRGSISLPYKATMEVTLQNGTVFSYPIEALYSGVDCTLVSITNEGP